MVNYETRYWNRVSFGAEDLVKENDKPDQDDKPRTKLRNKLIDNGGKIKMINKNNKKQKSIFSMAIAALMMMVFTTFIATSANASVDTARPTILSLSPENNELNVATHDIITVQFSEPMDASTINANTFTLLQRTTPSAESQLSEYRSIPIEGKVTYNGLVATFIPIDDQQNPLQPSQEYGNVFTATVTSEAKDLAGNSLARDYVWSFTTGDNLFYTSATTSQLDQSSASTGESAATLLSTQLPFIVAPADSASTDLITGQTIGARIVAASKSPWTWFIGGLLFLLVALILGFALKPASQKNKKNVPQVRSNPFGDVHPVIDIEGIGPVYNKELHTLGIRNTQQLWEADAVKVAHETGASLSSVKSWQNMAELASVKDIGPQYAELIERSGVHNINQLKNSEPNKLLGLLHKKQDSLKLNIQGNTPGHALVENWINQARDHKFSTSEGQIA